MSDDRWTIFIRFTPDDDSTRTAVDAMMSAIEAYFTQEDALVFPQDPGPPRSIVVELDVPARFRMDDFLDRLQAANPSVEIGVRPEWGALFS